MQKKKLYIKISILTLSSAVLSLLFYAFVCNLPKMIVLTSNNKVNAVYDENDNYLTQSECKYDSISSLPRDNSYIIKNDGNDIFVYLEMEKMYKIKAAFEDFPPADKNAIEKGIGTSDYSFLCEIVAYLES